MYISIPFWGRNDIYRQKVENIDTYIGAKKRSISSNVSL
jgi:hypothetical protein